MISITSVARAQRRGRLPPFPRAWGEHCFLSAGPSPRAWGELILRSRKCSLLRTIPTRVGRTNCWILHLDADTDHPHARGENNAVTLGNISEDGPSPRAWGERSHGPPQGRAGGPSPRAWGRLREEVVNMEETRTIPTRVGTTARPDLNRRGFTDHPHARARISGSGGSRGQTEFQVNLKLGLTRMAVPEPVSLCFHVTCAETQTNNLGVSLDE